MKKILFIFTLLFSGTASAQYWNNPIQGICDGEYRVVTTLGLGTGELQINRDQDFFGLASVGIAPAVGPWQVELRYSYFDDGGVSVDQWGVNFKVDFSMACDVQCLYWMAGWNYGEFDIDRVKQHGFDILVDDNGYDNYWNVGVGYRYSWNQNFETALEYNYNDVGGVAGFSLGHLRSLTVNFSYRW